MTQIPTAGAIILCGGRSTRMQRDKAGLPIGNETFLHRICRIAGDVAVATVVVASDEQVLPALPDGVIIARDPVPDQGPLAGILTGLQVLRQQSADFESAWVGSCDAPFVNADVICELLRLASDHQVVAVEDRHGLHPLGAVYRMTCEGQIKELYDSGERRMRTLLDRLDVRRVPAEQLHDQDPQLLFLQNINSPEEYDRWIRGV